MRTRKKQNNYIDNTIWESKFCIIKSHCTKARGGRLMVKLTLQDKILLCLNSVASLSPSSYTELVLCYLETAEN